jgi:hypothetical protein
MQRDAKAESDALRKKKEAEDAERRTNLTAAALAIEKFSKHMEKRLEALRGKPARANGEEHNSARQLAKAALEGADWTAEEKRSAADAISEWLPKVVTVDMKDERKKLKLALLRGEA